MNTQNLTGDCLDVMRQMPDKSVDLVFCSPPYEDARTYGIGFKLKGQEWVDWCIPRFMECLRVSRGLVAWVVEGKTRQFAWSATPALLMADLHRQGVKLRKPPAFCRVGIPGSGGPDWLRNDYEFIVCAASGKLPWSDNVAMGHTPKYDAGGDPSNRTASGDRVNKFGSMSSRGADGRRKMAGGRSAKVAEAMLNGLPAGAKFHTKNNGSEMRVQVYIPPEKANPGNLIRCQVGGGLLGSSLAHENEAPFPEKLAEFFVRSFCPPGGTVLDCFGGSGTTAAVAVRHGRNALSIDVRESQTELTGRRLLEVAA